MRNLIREKRKISIEYKRITPEVIRRLATIVDNEVKLEIQNNRETSCYFLYSVDAADDSSYESQTISIFEEKELIEQKVISQVNMRFNLIDNSKNIEIQLQHVNDDKNNGNYVLVSGDDPTWVNGVTTRINEIISLTEFQPKTSNLINVSVVVVGILIMVLYFRLFHYPIQKYNDNLATIIFLVISILTLWGGSSLINYLQEMYPLVELQTGSNYLQIPREKRKTINLILVTIVVPLLLALIYDVIKHYAIK
ncbi:MULTISPECIES: hypothetical protein [Niastella]|uniref:Uncharacterized protein n=1 Tax=Niastella soli TaxID=2821487 RepID=A0ABS3YQP8_9BACT|nr:hypothetical protein [Niastella soli]MBO9200222.1 hypothetical protein [Niastella soli]